MKNSQVFWANPRFPFVYEPIQHLIQLSLSQRWNYEQASDKNKHPPLFHHLFSFFEFFYNRFLPARLAPRISWRLGRSLGAQTRVAFHCLVTLPAVLHTPLLQKECNSSSIPLFGWPGEVAVVLKRVVGGEAAAKARRMARREPPEISEGLHDLGGHGGLRGGKAANDTMTHCF